MKGRGDSRPARIFFAAVLMAAVLLGGWAAWDEGARDLLCYDRTGLRHGEYWRLVTGHLVHLGRAHLLANLLALAVIGALFGREFRLLEWSIVTALSMLTIDLGLYFAEPALDWYAGLSGVLHGLWAAAAVAMIARRDTTGWILALLLALKLGWEQWFGPLPTSVAAAGTVIVDAHLYGAAGGLLAAVIIRPFFKSGQS